MPNFKNIPQDYPKLYKQKLFSNRDAIMRGRKY